jgi:hypothetical protein
VPSNLAAYSSEIARLPFGLKYTPLAPEAAVFNPSTMRFAPSNRIDGYAAGLEAIIDKASSGAFTLIDLGPMPLCCRACAMA